MSHHLRQAGVSSLIQRVASASSIRQLRTNSSRQLDTRLVISLKSQVVDKMTLSSNSNLVTRFSKTLWLSVGQLISSQLSQRCARSISLAIIREDRQLLPSRMHLNTHSKVHHVSSISITRTNSTTSTTRWASLEAYTTIRTPQSQTRTLTLPTAL